MVTCSAFTCKSRSGKKEAGITFHRFPVDPERRKRWLLEMKLPNFTPTKNDRICSKHFEEHYFCEGNKNRRLLLGAIPTIFTKNLQHLQEKKASNSFSTSSIPCSIKTEPSTSHSSQLKEESSPIKKELRLDEPEEEEEEESSHIKNLRRKLFQQQLRSKQQTKKIWVLSQKVKQYKNKIVNLKAIVKELNKKNLKSSKSFYQIKLPHSGLSISQKKSAKKRSLNKDSSLGCDSLSSVNDNSTQDE